MLTNSDSVGSIPRHVSYGAMSSYPSPTLVLLSARYISNKITVLWDYFVEQNVDLACVTETWMQEGDTVALNHLTLLEFLILQQWAGGCVTLLIHESSSFRAPHTKNLWH